MRQIPEHDYDALVEGLSWLDLDGFDEDGPLPRERSARAHALLHPADEEAIWGEDPAIAPPSHRPGPHQRRGN